MTSKCCAMEACSECVQYEIRPESVGLNHENPSDFVRSQWPISQKLYITYRLLISLLFIVWVTADILYETEVFYSDRAWTYLIYATNWSFVLLAVTTLFQTVCAMYYSIRSSGCVDRQTFDRMPIALKLQWILQNLGYNSAIVVTLSYWGFIAALDSSRVLQSEMSHLKHSMNTVFVVVELFISGVPIRTLHLFFTVGIGSAYSFFNAIYFLNDGTILQGRHFAYNLLDWSKPAEAIVTCILCVVLCVFAQAILFALYKIRVLIYSRTISGSTLHGKPESEMQSIVEEAPNYSSIHGSEASVGYVEED